MKIGILGAGISGLSVAKMLVNNFEVEILERESEIGGIAKTKQVEGVAYHKIGGKIYYKLSDILKMLEQERIFWWKSHKHIMKIVSALITVVFLR